ncbi:hypothetical protein VTN00DRAFT_9325 [Thermoascus crustaceus]|uniref:uncharacterized protein n=1 Tax=Thermoascus crustaceus TaxID=5088 RepID=UPI003743AC1C
MGPPRRGAPAPKKAAASGGTSKKKGAADSKRKLDPRPRDARGGTAARARAGQQGEHQDQDQLVDLSTTIPLTLQQLLLNVFKTALLPSRHGGGGGRRDVSRGVEDPDASASAETQEEQEEELDIKTLIQTIKSHLYNRDFASAFADAGEEHLRAYALRWSATRALGYAGVLKGVLRDLLLFKKQGTNDVHHEGFDDIDDKTTKHVVCIGGGAGAEIVALAGVWRDMRDEVSASASRSQEESLAAAVEGVSLDEGQVGTDPPVNDNGTSSSPDDHPVTAQKSGENLEEVKEDGKVVVSPVRLPNLSVTAVDIADWSAVVERLSRTITSPAVPGTKGHSAPLLPLDPEKGVSRGNFDVHFQWSDVLGLTDEELRRLLLPRDGDTSGKTALVTLMFTLNELFSTSMAKTTAFLLRMTDLLEPGTTLLVVDSPGSYSTVSLGKKSTAKSATATEAEAKAEQQQQRTYPMKFLLDHTLLSVASGKWDRIFSQDSRWFRRDATKLRYDVGEGAGLEDMRFQIHIYRRVNDDHDD